MRPSRVLCWSLLGACLIGGQTASAADKSFKERSDVGVRFEQWLAGDDNILRLSDSDLSAFRTDPTLQTGTSRTSDWHFDNRVRLDFTLRSEESRRRFWRFRLDQKFAEYRSGAANDFNTLRLQLIRQLKPGRSYDLSFFKVNNFYLRDYRDLDTGLRQQASFDSTEYRARGSWRFADRKYFSRPTLTGAIAWEELRYNNVFEEYDTEGLRLEALLAWDFNDSWDARVGYGRRNINNVGFRPQIIGMPTTNTGAGDGSFDEDVIDLGLRWNVPGARRGTRLLADLEWRARSYTTDRLVADDPIHAGRDDSRVRVGLRAEFPIKPKLTIIPFIERDSRDSDGDFANLGNIKDFEANRAGVGLRWNVR